jgi:hypothetical protein
MSQTLPQPDQTRVSLTRTAGYRDSYANSVQVRLSVWDFHLVFGTIEQKSPEEVDIANFQGIYLSPQQAKALHSVLSHNLSQYEQAFGEISLEAGRPGEPRFTPGGPVH